MKTFTFVLYGIAMAIGALVGYLDSEFVGAFLGILVGVIIVSPIWSIVALVRWSLAYARRSDGKSTGNASKPPTSPGLTDRLSPGDSSGPAQSGPIYERLVSAVETASQAQSRPAQKDEISAKATTPPAADSRERSESAVPASRPVPFYQQLVSAVTQASQSVPTSTPRSPSEPASPPRTESISSSAPSAPARPPERPHPPVASPQPVQAPQTSSPSFFSRLTASAKGTRWVPPGEVLQVGPYRFDSGMVYFTDANSTIGEASLIDVRLPVGRPVRGPEADLGYWSDYTRITPNQRATYLEWLANGRRDADPSTRDFGYLFLFFYGIERRFLVDRGADQAAIRAIADVMTTYAPFGRSSSLSSYTCQLLHFWGTAQGDEYYSKFWPWILGLPSSHLAEDDLAQILANLYETQRNLPFEVAVEIASRHEMAKRSTVQTRVPEEFRQLLQTRYRETYPDGLVLRAAKRARWLEYRPANPSLLQMTTTRSRDSVFSRQIPNVPGVPSQFGKLIDLWNGCVDDLAAYSRAKGKAGGDFSVKAHAALPPELRASVAHPLGEKWLSLLSQQDYATAGYALLPIGDLAKLFNQEQRPKLTATQARDIVIGVETLAFATEPDLRAKGIQLKWEDEVGVFPNEQGGPPAESSRAFLAAKALLTLCYSIAAADGTVDENELGPIRGIIEQAAGLHESEHKRLLISERLLSRDPSRATAAATKVAKIIPEESRNAVADLLVQIACADGIVTKDERKALLKIFKDLQFDASYLDRLIGKALRGFDEAEVVAGGPCVPGEAIPQPREAPTPGLRLDFARIASITKETQEVIAVLSAVMVEEEELEAAETPSSDSDAPLSNPSTSIQVPAWVSGAPVRYHGVIVGIARRTSIPRTEFDAICAEFHVMPSGAFDAINEWAEESLGDFLLTDDDPMAIASDLLPEES